MSNIDLIITELDIDHNTLHDKEVQNTLLQIGYRRSIGDWYQALNGNIYYELCLKNSRMILTPLNAEVRFETPLFYNIKISNSHSLDKLIKKKINFFNYLPQYVVVNLYIKELDSKIYKLAQRLYHEQKKISFIVENNISEQTLINYREFINEAEGSLYLICKTWDEVVEKANTLPEDACLAIYLDELLTHEKDIKELLETTKIHFLQSRKVLSDTERSRINNFLDNCDNRNKLLAIEAQIDLTNYIYIKEENQPLNNPMLSNHATLCIDLDRKVISRTMDKLKNSNLKLINNVKLMLNSISKE